MDTLLRRAFFGLGQSLLLLAFVLFAFSGTLGYWQAWAYLALFLAACVLITLYLRRNDPALLERRMSGWGGEKQRAQRIIGPFIALSMFAAFAIPALDRRFGWSHVPDAVALAALAMVALGFVIIFLVFRANSFAAATVDLAPGQRVISTGPYSIVRHPMYLGVLIMMVATPIALGSWWGLVAVVPAALIMGWRAVEEEKFLVQSLPGYADYRRRVRDRIVPHVW